MKPKLEPVPCRIQGQYENFIRKGRANDAWCSEGALKGIEFYYTADSLWKYRLITHFEK